MRTRGVPPRSRVTCRRYSGRTMRSNPATAIRSVIAGHIASDNLGLNLLLDEVEKREPFEVIECSGFRRVKRV
jgi:hypothetical protein